MWSVSQNKIYYRSMEKRFEQLEKVWEERYQARPGYWQCFDTQDGFMIEPRPNHRALEGTFRPEFFKLLKECRLAAAVINKRPECIIAVLISFAAIPSNRLIKQIGKVGLSIIRMPIAQEQMVFYYCY
jgi:hypothetical protein